jgi:prepilin-type N-terminal cleavage/methylation domain-containing protein
MVKKAFTLIELIFVIVIIGFLAAVAVPKFLNLTSHAKKSAVKSVVTSVQTAVDEIHGKWIIDDNFNWKPLNGGTCQLNSDGYPDSLDDGKGESDLFKCVLKIPVPSCADKKSGCWEEYENNKYEYYFTPDKILKIEYNATDGTLRCLDGTGVTQDECKKIIY